MKKKTIIIFGLLILATISLIVSGVFLMREPEQKDLEPPNQEEIYTPKESLLKDVENGVIKLTNIDVKKIDDHYEFNFTMTNTGKKNTNIQIINYVFYDEEGKELGRIENEIQSMEPGESTNYITPSKNEKLFTASEVKIELSPFEIEE